MRVVLIARMRERRAEIEQALLTRACSIADPAEVSDPIYREGLANSIAVALDYALEAIEIGEERAPPPPPALLAQARMAARSRVALDVVLRRYLAGYTLLGEFLNRESQRAGLPPDAGQVRHGVAAVLDRLLAAVSEEYSREQQSRVDSVGRRRAERVDRLLAGEPISTSMLGYDLEGHHTALVVVECDTTEKIRGLARSLGCRLLLARRDEVTVWAWLGDSGPVDPGNIVDYLTRCSRRECMIAVGEPGENVDGWRLSHRQAAAALPIAQRQHKPIVRYADVPLLAAALKDDLLAASLRKLYIDPLGRGQKGQLAKEALHAYFDAGRNVSKAAAKLGANRNTLGSRLRVIEERVGRRLDSCAAEFATALGVDRLRLDGQVRRVRQSALDPRAIKADR